MKKTLIYNNNSGGITAIVYENEKLQNIVPDLEYEQFTFENFTEMACSGFPYADDFEYFLVEHGMAEQTNMKQFAEEVQNNDELIAEFLEDGTYNITDIELLSTYVKYTMGLCD